MLFRFYLQRNEDVSGVSGVGQVAVGALFPSGRAIIEWRTVTRSIEIFDSIAVLEKVHGHDGRTVVVWAD